MVAAAEAKALVHIVNDPSFPVRLWSVHAACILLRASCRRGVSLKQGWFAPVTMPSDLGATINEGSEFALCWIAASTAIVTWESSLEGRRSQNGRLRADDASANALARALRIGAAYAPALAFAAGLSAAASGTTVHGGDLAWTYELSVIFAVGWRALYFLAGSDKY